MMSKRLLALILLVALLATTGLLIYNRYKSTPQLEQEIKELEQEVKVQEKKITETRKQNDTRIKERVQEVYQEYEGLEDLPEDELDAKWLEFMDEVRKRNYDRRTTATQ